MARASRGFPGEAPDTASEGIADVSSHLPRPQTDARPPLATFYEAVAFDTLGTLWRGRLVIASFVAGGLLLALLVSLVVERRYTAEALIRLDFGRGASSPSTKGPPSASMDAAALVESEARLIRSPGMARRVAARLNLENDGTLASSFFSRFLSALSPPGASVPARSNSDLAARELAKKLVVTNDLRSYLITIAVTSNQPDQSARLANAFAVEYLNDHIVQHLRELEADARTALQEAAVTYGEKHPSLIQARANFAAAAERVRAQEKLTVERPEEMASLPGIAFTKAEPVSIPSGPNLVSTLGVCLLGSLVVGVAFVMLRERNDTSFRTELSVPAETGVRCVGMIPRTANRTSAKRTVEQREAFRSLCLAVGLAGQRASSRIVMVASAIPSKGKSNVVNGLAGALEEDGHRVLIVDTTPSSHSGASTSIDDVLGNPELFRRFLIEQGDQRTSVLRRASGLNGAHNPFASFTSVERNLGQLLTAARDEYDVIIIDTPPAMLFADCAFFGRFADLSLLVANWKETPRAIVVEAVRRLRDNLVRVDGIILAEVDLDQYPLYSSVAPTHYLRKFDTANHF